ncbi:MAG: NINE protein [Actinomycetaceae bacterium]|nr:NINE protein [Actinomycetaceae bacterium]
MSEPNANGLNANEIPNNSQNAAEETLGNASQSAYGHQPYNTYAQPAQDSNQYSYGYTAQGAEAASQDQPGYQQYGQPQYGYPGQPSYYQPQTPGTKSKIAAGLLGIFLGAFGVHKFYLGYTVPGVILLLLTILTFGIAAMVTSVIGVVEGIIYLTMDDMRFYYTYEVGKKEWF